uniref:Ribonuclease H-like domain-containing protein n=1 Tax=Tanacetum cinerariifolium TaxID=118510 RepID=A0A699HFC3_TANCI|nr:ribonuclease H-like domain-containing protein [Tanacetum cinerariifolium]
MGIGSQSSIVKSVDRLSLYTSSISHILKSPFLSLNDHQWCNDMYDKYNALVKNGTWILVLRPSNVNLVRFMWLFKHKFHADGTLSRYKAPLVTNGSSQQLGVDFDETFSPVVKPATSRTVFSLVVSRKWPIHQLDFRNAFLNGDLSETLLERAHMVNCNPSRTLVDTKSKLGPKSSKRQHTLSRSSAEAEYRSVANVVAETAWLRNLLRELHSPLSTATLVYCDNVSAIYMSTNPVQHQRTKHIEIDIHFVCDMVTVGHVRVLNVPSRYHYTDNFTKGLLSALFEDFWSSLSVRPPPTPTMRAY